MCSISDMIIYSAELTILATVKHYWQLHSAPYPYTGTTSTALQTGSGWAALSVSGEVLLLIAIVRIVGVSRYVV